MNRLSFRVAYKASVGCDLGQEVTDQCWFPNLYHVTLNACSSLKSCDTRSNEEANPSTVGYLNLRSSTQKLSGKVLESFLLF